METYGATTMNAKTNILVVDDEEIVRRAHTRTLASPRCQVREALNGSEALQAMEEQPADVVLLDLRMPGMDGMTVLKALKARWPQAEVIIITGYPSVDTAKEAIPARRLRLPGQAGAARRGDSRGQRRDATETLDGAPR